MHRKRKRVVLTLAGIVLAASVPSRVTAQLSVEGRVGGSFPSGELSDDPGLNQSLGVSIALEAMYHATPNVALYAGGSRQSFHCDDCPADVTTSGFVAGVKYVFPGTALDTWLRGGVMLHRASIDGDSQDWGAGVDAGLGVDIAIRPSMSIVPAVRLNSYGSGPLSLTYVTFDLGINFVPALE